MPSDNRKRALAEIVSLDAWHEGFGPKRRQVNLHVDVAFTEGRVGDKSVRFRLRLNRAEVVVVIPPTEPAKVDKASVARDTPGRIASATTTSKKKSRAVASLAAKVKADLIPKLGASGEVRSDHVLESSVAMTETIEAMRVIQVKTPDGDYSWLVEPIGMPHLEGHPWNAKEAPRLKVVDKRANPSKGIEPNVRVEVRCRREDIEISDIALSDETAWERVMCGPYSKNKQAAAEAVIRTRLFEAGLMSGDLSDPYAYMTISAAIAEGP